MRKRVSVRSVCVFILCAVLAGGCGFFARFGFDKSVAQAEEAKQKAVAAEANRFAGLQFAQAERTYQEAMALKDQGQYPEAKAKLAEAAGLYERAAQMAPGGRMQFEQQAAGIGQSLEEVRMLLERAQRAGAAETAPEMLLAARQALQTAINEVASATGAAAVEPAALINLATPGGVIDVARTMAQGVLNTTLATQVAAASQEMTVLWDNLMQSGAAVSRASEVAELEATRGQLLDLLGRQDYAGFLSVYGPFRESALAMVKAAFEGQVSAAMRAAEEGLEKARDMGAEDYAAEEYGEASQALEAARAARDAGNYTEALSQAKTSTDRSGAAVSRMQAEVESLLEEARGLLETARQVDAPRVRSAKFTAGQNALTAAERAKEAGQADVLLAQTRLAHRNLKEAVEETRRERAETMVEAARSRLERLTAQKAQELAPQLLVAAEDAVGQMAGRDPQVEFDALVVDDTAAGKALDELEKALSDLAQRAVGAARQVVEKAAEADQGRYAPAEYQSAKRALDTAVTALADKNYAAAIETAARAGEAGQEAYAAATLAHAREKLEAASGEAAAARAAGAESFAPQLLAAGESAQSEAAALVAEESGEAALAAAERALTSFSGARLFKIRAAEAARAAAETAQAPSLEAAAFAAADQTLAAAREAMDAHRYDEANRLADQAAAQFASAESRSWERRVAELAPQAEGEIAFLTNNLAVQYATDYFRPALDAFLDMRGNRAAGLYKEAYAAGERCLVEAGKARGQLEASLESVVARETRRLEQLGEIVRDEEGLAMAESARAAGRTAVVTRRTGDLRASFVAYENLSKALDGAVAQVVTRNRQVMYAQRKAQLDAWRATGAEPLAAATFKSLSEQIESLLAGPATLANYERIRGADQQIAAELDVMEETIRLSTEQMLAETRSNLESAAQEGGGRIFPNRFMRAEAAWRQAGDMPKGRNYPEVAAAVVDARNQSIELVEAIRLYRAEGVYRTAAYREIDNANNLLKKFAYVIEVGPLGWRTAQSSHRADLFAGVQRIISASEFYLTAQTLEQRVKDMTPPPTMVKLHALVVQSFEELTLTGELFQKYGDYTYGTESRRKFIEAAFDHYHKREKLMLEVDRLMLEGTRVEEAFRYDQPTAVRRADDFLTRLQQKSRGIEKMLGNLIWGYEL